MMKILLLFAFVSSILLLECHADDKAQRELIQNRRSFLQYFDQDKLISYLSSFGTNPTSAESERHEVFKRSSSKRKVKKTKKVPLTTTEASIEEIPTRPLAPKNNGKNFTVLPRHIVHFELNDAKFSEEYEKLRQSRKVRVKRSAETRTNSSRSEKFITKDTFVQPKEFFKFSYLDAVIKSPEATETKETSEKKTKREIAVDSTATETKVHVSSPMRGHRSTMHVSYDEISPKLQKMIEGALKDAVSRGKAVEGDYLKFFYGDKIIKVPVTMSKYIASTKSKETTTYGTKIVVFPQEESKLEAPQLLATKNAYIQLKNAAIKYESKPSFLPTIPTTLATTTENAESYVNFETPIVVQPDVKENSFEQYKKSVYYYKGDNSYAKNSVSSPGPVLFDLEPTTPSSIEPLKTHFKNYIFHPPTQVSAFKDATPITEHVDESYIPFVPQKHHAPIQRPTSYTEYAGNYADLSDHQAKNYEFGYHVSDYKTGNNFGHSQKSTEKETKGQYSILLPDGRVQMVKYYADDSGFHADVSYQNVH